MMGGLMDGFPPAPGAQVTLANWRTAPFNRWAFHHVREIVPSADIPNDPAAVRALPSAAGDPLTDLRIPAADGRTLSLDGFLAATATDAIVVLHRGRLVAERYASGMAADTPHILMSVSKSLLGLLAGILAAQGTLDPAAPVTAILPELAGTAYDGASVRHLLDMRVGVAFDEDYTATGGRIIEYRKATNWNPLGPGEAPGDLRGFYRALVERDGPHGGRFHYVSPNTDLLGWLIERAAGMRYADLASRLLWRPIGAERPAYITVDRLGAPRCAGGFCATARDLARVGQLLVDDGRAGDASVIPAGWIDDIARNGDPAAWDAGSFTALFAGRRMSYRSQWYVDRSVGELLLGFGVHGQNLFVDRARALVVAKFSSQAAALDAGLIDLTARAIEAMRQHLDGA